MRQDDVIERALEQQHRKHDGNMAFSISFPIPQMNTIRRKEGCHLVQEEVRAAVDETRTCKAVGMKQQGAWTRWENAVERKVTWAEFWSHTTSNFLSRQCTMCFQAHQSCCTHGEKQRHHFIHFGFFHCTYSHFVFINPQTSLPQPSIKN